MLDIFFQVIYNLRIFAAAGPGGRDMAVWIRNALRLKGFKPPQLFACPFLCGLLIPGGFVNRQVTKESVCDSVDPILVEGLLADFADGDLIRIRKVDFGPAGQRDTAVRKFSGKGVCLRNLQPASKGSSAGGI